jgi:AcrR family transcriptional regulator
MSGEQRREAILRAATEVFATNAYRSATTAAIARASGITEPVLYHHFGNKAALYAACLDAAWDDLRTRWEAAIEAEPDPSRWMLTLALTGFSVLEDDTSAARLWQHVMSEVIEDEEAKVRLVRFTTELHDYVSEAVAKAQAAGGISAALDPRAEAWIFLSIGVLHSLSSRLGGIVEEDFPQIVAARQRWYAIA